MNKMFFILILAVSALFFQGCSNLHEDILNEQDNSSLVKNSSNAAMVAAPSIAVLRDFTTTSGIWGLTECSTDECCFPTRGSDWNDANSRALFKHTYDYTNTHIKEAWNALMAGLTRSNTSLYYLSSMEQTDTVKEYTGEVYFIRDLCMYYLMDYWGHFPMREYTGTNYLSQPEILSRSEALDRIINNLDSIIPNLKEKGDVPYGRITRAAAQTLLAHIYLNYQVFTGTAPAFSDGTAKWDKVISLCDEIINSGKYKLADDYWKLYLSDNATYADQTEAILPIVFDQEAGIPGPGWCNMDLHYSQTFNNFTSFNNGPCTTPTFVDSWDRSDPRFSDSRLKSQTGFNIGILIGQQYSVKGEKLKTRQGSDLIFTEDFSVDNSTEAQGARIVKYAPDPDYKWGSGSDNDVMFFRYADIYLMRGEAKFRNNDVSGALADINAVRNARGVKPYTVSDLTLEDFYKERGYEFYWDGACRRDDMVRFNHYCEARYDVDACDAFRILFPLPNTALESNSELKQNEGYAN
ncbi:MAG: RagB/SusD family nutrient uptake outer membrane protein [Prevotella sp.]|nr:RagB/SusD family nutrient uptake outer membrane protein [Prevotella sp.]